MLQHIPSNIYLFRVCNRKMWNMLKVNNKDTRTASITSTFLLLTLTYFRPFSSVSIVDFEQVNVSWDVFKLYPLNDRCYHLQKSVNRFALQINWIVFICEYCTWDLMDHKFQWPQVFTINLTAVTYNAVT